MAMYLKSAGGNWSAAGTWSATGAGGVDSVGPPLASTDCIAELLSGNLTVDTAVVCRSFDTTSGTGTWGGTLFDSGSVSITIGDATAGAGNVALKLNSGITYTATNAFGIAFISTSATQQSIDFGSKNCSAVTINCASNGNYAVVGNLSQNTISSNFFTVTKGAIHMDGASNNSGLTHNLSAFSSNNANVRTINLGTATFNIGLGTGNRWDFSTVSNLTFTGGSSTVNMTGGTVTFTGGGLTYGTVNMNGSGFAIIASSNTFANLLRTGTAVKTDGLTLNANQTVTTLLTLSSNNSTNRLLIQSNTLASARTLTAASVVVNNIVDFQDITGAGAATWTVGATGATALGNCGGTSGITFTTGATQTATMSTNKNWSDVTIWTTRVPLPQDDVSGASITGGTLTADMPRLGKSIDWTSATGNPGWSFGSTTNTIYGSITLISVMTLSGTNTTTLAGRSSFTLTSSGHTFTQAFTINAPSGTYTLGDNFTTNRSALGAITLTNGAFVDAGYIVSIAGTTSSLAQSSGTLTITGTWNMGNTAAGNFWNCTGGTVTATGSTIVLTTASSSTRTFVGGSKTYGILNYIVTGSSGELDVTGSNTFNTINYYDTGTNLTARTLKFVHGTTTTITGAFNVNGSFATYMPIVSDTASVATITGNIGTVNCYFITPTWLTMAGTSTWNAINSTDGGNNTGWNFSVVAIIQAYVVSAWKTGTKLQVQIGGVWKVVNKAQMRISGVWKSVF